jgi:hypothetical protein
VWRCMSTVHIHVNRTHTHTHTRTTQRPGEPVVDLFGKPKVRDLDVSVSVVEQKVL